MRDFPSGRQCGVAGWVVGWFVMVNPIVVAQSTPRAPSGIALAPKAIYAVNADGTGWRRHFSLPQVSDLASPAVSRDGRWLAFEGWSTASGQSPAHSSIYVLSLPRDEFRILGLGSLPSWSPDGKKLACSFYSVGAGTLDWESQQADIIDRLGWGAQYSPDGKFLVGVSGPDLWSYDVTEKKKTTIFDGQGQYQQVLHNFTWSPRGDVIALVARKSNTVREIISFKVSEGIRSLKVHVRGKMPGDKLAWHPTEPRILFSAEDPERHRPQLWEFNPEQDAEPKRFAGQDGENVVESPCWSPDGKTLFCIARMK